MLYDSKGKLLAGTGSISPVASAPTGVGTRAHVSGLQSMLCSKSARVVPRVHTHKCKGDNKVLSSGVDGSLTQGSRGVSHVNLHAVHSQHIQK